MELRVGSKTDDSFNLSISLSTRKKTKEIDFNSVKRTIKKDGYDFKLKLYYNLSIKQSQK